MRAAAADLLSTQGNATRNDPLHSLLMMSADVLRGHSIKMEMGPLINCAFLGGGGEHTSQQTPSARHLCTRPSSRWVRRTLRPGHALRVRSRQ